MIVNEDPKLSAVESQTEGKSENEVTAFSDLAIVLSSLVPRLYPCPIAIDSTVLHGLQFHPCSLFCVIMEYG